MAERKDTTATRPPKFSSAAEAGEFWDTNSPENYPNEFEEVQVRFTSPLIKRGLTVKLDQDTITQLRQVAHKRGIGPSTLARMWIMEHLQAEQSTPSKR